ncbi:hypothetical protein [Roseomonas elaeocarpi]|uniref:Uncharacterized protein n=1 Tax=Roseomonas elaeocarpi TaxID=907779 RepID=A0ABV6JS98_9PROT
MMRFKSLVSSTALSLILAAAASQTASAQSASGSSHVLQRSGSWTTSYNSVASGGGQCVIARQLLGRGFLVRGAPDGTPARVQIFRDSWRVPPNVSMNVAFDVDGRTQWIGQFAAPPPDRDLSGRNRETVIEAEFPNSETAVRFLSGFAGGRLMTIRFLDGNEGTWRAPLDGSSRAVTAYGDCLRASGGTQPFSAPAASATGATQPFNAPAN